MSAIIIAVVTFLRFSSLPKEKFFDSLSLICLKRNSRRERIADSGLNFPDCGKYSQDFP